LAVGFIGVPEPLPCKIREGFGIKHEEAETKLKGTLELDRFHVERPKPATTIMSLVLKKTRKDFR
jgi:hypothetical protein